MNIDIEMEIEPVAVVKLDERSYELFSATQVGCPIDCEMGFYLGVSMSQAEAFLEDTAVPAEGREVLRSIVDEAKGRRFDGYLLVADPSC